MLGYLELIILVQFVYVSIAACLAIGFHLILGYFGIETPRWLLISLAIGVFFLAPSRAYLTAKTMYAHRLGLLKAHQSVTAEFRAVLSFLPLVGHLFGSERSSGLVLDEESPPDEPEPDVRESPLLQLYVAVFLIILGAFLGLAAFGSFSWIALSIVALVGFLAYRESQFSR